MNKHGGYYGDDYKEIMDFSVNINPLGPSESVKEKMIESIENIDRYPEIRGNSAIKALSNHMSINEKNIILGNGAIELIYLFARAINPQKVLIIGPTFNEYRRAFEMNDSEVIEISRLESKEFSIDYENLVDLIYKEKPKVLILCNPNNPTGEYVSPIDFHFIVQAMDNINGFTVVDESFMDFADKETFEKYIYNNNIFLLRSMTKFYGLPGIRLGYGLGNDNLIGVLNKFKEPWTMNSIALDILPYVIKDKKFIKDSLKWIKEERKFLYEELNKISALKVFEPNANFILFKLEKGNPKEFFNYLLSKKIHVRTCEDFKGLGDRYFRISVKEHKNNKNIINTIEKWNKEVCG
ncbi:threonine-phosphate decarboxylase [Clostridium sp. D2Q-14]|uniref:threonine-phosphate decarboxylase CobD n=1 Tax=Anaeromonas gelatinilytica TaxID=2683194 RepID=UPI00193B6BE2|nr:threonine-phosphate decarboxylase CobD [Anaeromonas gelatinilytica]MBS4535498.1 threonine-phosphate decarboxylase [Anaeromonas gelatinilytica]